MPDTRTLHAALTDAARHLPAPAVRDLPGVRCPVCREPWPCETTRAAARLYAWWKGVR